jgi:hypothetical protein
MDDPGTNGRNLPPYLGFGTLQNFLDSLKQGIPSRIDRSLMYSLGGTVQKQLLHALRYLGLIDEWGLPQPTLKQLVSAEGTEREHFWRDLLQTAYPFLLGQAARGFDLTIATPRQLTEKFQATGIQGESVRKAETFFLRAAEEAGLSISPHIPSRSYRPGRALGQLARPRNGQKARRRSNAEESTALRTTSPVGTIGDGIPRTPSIGQGVFAWEELSSALSPLGAGYLSLEGLLRQLPMSRRWTVQRREQWLKAFTATLDLMIEVGETGTDHELNTDRENYGKISS